MKTSKDKKDLKCPKELNGLRASITWNALSIKQILYDNYSTITINQEKHLRPVQED
jgi:hypothetical protein